MSTIATLLTGIKAAIAGVSALSGVDVYDADVPEDAAEEAKRRPGIVIAYRGRQKLDDGPLTSRDNYRMRYGWTITLVAQDVREASGALTRTLGLAEMGEALDDIRLTSIGTVGDETVYPILESESIVKAGDGAAVMLVQEWTTSEVLI